MKVRIVEANLFHADRQTDEKEEREIRWI